jgi:hypothetical protein
LEAIGVVDHESSNTIMFNLDDYKSRFSHQLLFQIEVVFHNQHIHRTILDEGELTCVMSLNYWKGLKSLGLNQYPTMLKSFEERGFRPHRILQSLTIKMGGGGGGDYSHQCGSSWLSYRL